MTTRTTHRQTVQPTNVVRLMEAVGPTRAAAKLGVSTTLLHKSRKEGEVNKVVETAATYALDHLADAAASLPQARAQRGGESLFLIAVPTAKAKTLQRMVSALGAELVAA